MDNSGFKKRLKEQLFVRTNRLFNRKEQIPFSITNKATFEIEMLDKSNSSKDGEDMNQEEQCLNGNKRN
ncbi:hypothetical protein D910_05621 [Dendroctonus ponderosae]|uniref:Uncharacterized protein n=1 Tax=Dendroctonus ponderosae TaxID=77166 RepID=U4U7A9_DENPD|nr:hypothetical protein D910_05621 [Dendroctonus ponderosae]